MEGLVLRPSRCAFHICTTNGTALALYHDLQTSQVSVKTQRLHAGALTARLSSQSGGGADVPATVLRKATDRRKRGGGVVTLMQIQSFNPIKVSLTVTVN